MKVPSSRFQKFLRRFNMLTVERCSETVFFFGSELTKFFTACKFRNKVAMTMIFFLKMFEYLCRFRNRLKKQKKFFVLKIIAFESGTTNSQNPEHDTFHWESTCYETQLRFNISLGEIFFKSGSLRVMRKNDENALMQILHEFGTL